LKQIMISMTFLHQVLVVKARCIYRRAVTANGYLGNEQRALFRVMDLRMVLYPLVFIFCWGPGVFLSSAQIRQHGGCYEGRQQQNLYPVSVSGLFQR
ncbi:hypothetical protein GOODEAATRI_017105, partial [Goodea atripinnis]